MLVLAATLAILAYGLMSPVLGVLLPGYALTAEQQGSLAMAQALGLVLASLCAGPFVDAKGNKAALISGLTLIVISLAGAPKAPGYSGLLVVYFLLGIAGGTVVTGANSLVAAVESNRRGPALNFLNLFFGLGGIITTYVGSMHTDSATLCYSIAAVATLALLLNVATRMPFPSGAASFRLNEASVLLTNPVLLLLSLFLFLYVACEVGVWNWFKIYLMRLHFDEAAAGRVVSYGFASGILVGRVVVSRLLIRIPAFVVTLVAPALMTVTTYFMLSLRSNVAITIAVFCAGLSMAPVFPTVLAIVADAFSRGTATAMGIVLTSGWLGLAVSSPAIGALAKGNNYHRALLLVPSFSALMVLVNVVLRSIIRRQTAV